MNILHIAFDLSSQLFSYTRSQAIGAIILVGRFSVLVYLGGIRLARIHSVFESYLDTAVLFSPVPVSVRGYKIGFAFASTFDSVFVNSL